jgi:hypothetical protein
MGSCCNAIYQQPETDAARLQLPVAGFKRGAKKEEHR